MYDCIHAAQRRKLCCWTWISLVVLWCSYMIATEPVLWSMHYARSVISYSGAALLHNLGTLFNKDMEPNVKLFFEKIQPKSSVRPHGRASPLGCATSGWVWVFLPRIVSWIQFTRHFTEFVVVETKQFVSSKINVILTRQTCRQRSSMSAGSKHQALEYYFD